jgi:trk system potassium uptake protein TrkH
VNVTLILLIFIGGIGFIVWDDVVTKKLALRKYRLHTKLVLVTSFTLLFGGAFVFYLFEHDNLMMGMSVKETILASLFSSMTARTAGFNTIDMGAMKETSKLFNIFLMFIGGSPGSTAGGVKTTTLAVFVIYVLASWRGTNKNNIWGRRLEDDVLKKSALICANNMTLAILATFIIAASQPFAMMDVLTETFSAISTVGMSTGLTRDLNMLSRGVIIFLMYCGRIGSLTFALMFLKKKKVPPVQLPVEKILIG